MMAGVRAHTNSGLAVAWLRQLRRAYAQLLWARGIKTEPASLELCDDEKVWGRWRERGRRIAINRALILEQPWPAVLGILGHEAAHQLVSDFYPNRDRLAPHGPEFQRMAEALGLADFYRSPTVDLRAECPRPFDEERDQDPESQAARAVLGKIHKLLALSNSPVAAEAENAAAAAARLMARHNLTVLESEKERPGGYLRLSLSTGSRVIDSRRALIAGLLGRHFFVEVIFVPVYNALRDCEEKTIEIFGRAENAKLAEHVHHFLMERTESLWRLHHREHPGGGRVARDSFITGLLEGFGRKLDQAAQETPDIAPDVSALVLAQDQGLKNFIRRHHPRLRTVRSGGRRQCPESQAAGRAAGGALSLNPPLEENSSAGPTRALPPAGA